MSKFTKKSLAVLTTAAIMASTASIVAYAAVSVTIPDGLEVFVNDEPWDGAAIKGQVITWKAPKGKIATLVANDDKVEGDSYTIVTNSDVLVFTLENDPNAGGGSSEPTPAGEENFDSVVWVNGKDTKASKDGLTPASLYKTEQYDQVMVSAGGKWQVAVTPASVDSVEAFMQEFDEKGKIKNAKDYKNLGSAKIKEGTVTVTAGKAAGEINVWVYEVKSKVVVAPVEGNKYADLGVEPEFRTFTVKVAPTMAVSAAEPKVGEDGITIAAVDTSSKLGKNIEAGKDVTVYFGDKKAAASLDATYVLMDAKGKAALEVDETGVAKIENGTAQLIKTENGVPALKITADSAAAAKAKIGVSVKNVESGKVAKVALTVTAAEKKDDDTTGGDTETGGETETPAA